MATYTKTEKKVKLALKGESRVVTLDSCDICGTAVLDTQKHDEFHERIDGIGSLARRADDTAGMMRPIGPGYNPPTPTIDVAKDFFDRLDADLDEQA